MSAARVAGLAVLGRVVLGGTAAAGLLVGLAAGASAQDFNLDFGPAGTAPSSGYAAAGTAGLWIALPALHGTTTPNLVDTSGTVTSVSLTQIGGFEVLTTDDPATNGDDAVLMDDYLVTFDANLESCVFLDGMEPGEYEVLIYAWMPSAAAIEADTFVDQEQGVPHYVVGGAWPAGHAEGVTYSRHLAIVGADGNLDFHSGVVAGADEELGAALNGAQIRRLRLFGDGFESGDVGAWSGAGT